MRRLDILIGASIGAWAFAAIAQAADVARSTPMPPPDFRYAPPAPPPLQPASGWYLRGDLGARWYAAERATAQTGFTDPVDNTFGTGFWGGLGVGFKAGGPMRVDLTVDYGAPVSYAGTVVTAGDVSAKLQSATALINVYYDIGTWRGWTPYIGAGLGAAYLRTSDYQSAVTPPLTSVSDFGRWNMAWAAMAGVSYQFSRSLSVDAGYRYLGLGSAETMADASGKLTINNVAAHEVRIGLRWMLDVPLR